jgi:catechol 2,3-dioxygenase-like lactoylglutathione lyase family enzyme
MSTPLWPPVMMMRRGTIRVLLIPCLAPTYPVSAIATHPRECTAMSALPRLIGINHIALEVGDIDAALAFYGKIFQFSLRGRGKGQAFIDMGDQFLALSEASSAHDPVRKPDSTFRDHARDPHQDRHRHFGLVVDDCARVRELAEAAGARMVEGPFLDFLDPWGNRIEVVAYADIQFSKAEHVLRGMAFDGEKSDKAKQQLADKGMAPAKG